jgi:hypothetical protein
MAEVVKAYPLAWPLGWKRTQNRGAGRFYRGESLYVETGPGTGYSKTAQREITINEAINRVLGELRRFGVAEGDAVISTNLVLRLDGLPHSKQAQPADPGAAVYWRRAGEAGMKCMAIDRYSRVEHNIAAIAATLDAMRAIERHGGAEILERTFTGFAALPAPGQTLGRDWRRVLEIDHDAPVDQAVIDMQYRKLASKRHPDKGGKPEEFHELTVAREQALNSIGA